MADIVNAVATNGDTPLHVAMKLSDESRCLILTKLLVEAGCSPCALNADDKPPIQVAVARGFVSVAEYLVSQGVRIPSRILFAALQAPAMKRIGMIRLLSINALVASDASSPSQCHGGRSTRI